LLYINKAKSNLI